MATYTTVAICNKALVLCGASPITALTDDSVNARALNACFDISLMDFLTECKWNFSTTRSTLATVSTATLVPWYHAGESVVYTRPAGALRVWELSELNAVWREEGNYIIADATGLGAKWTYNNSEVGLWSPAPISAFMDKLCSEISYQIINSVQKAESFFSKYTKVSLPKAMSQNSQTGTQQVPNDDEWTIAKGGNGGNQARSYS